MKNQYEIYQSQLTKIFKTLLINKYPTLFNDIVVRISPEMGYNSKLYNSVKVVVLFRPNELLEIPVEQRLFFIKNTLGIHEGSTLWDYFENIISYIIPFGNFELELKFEIHYLFE